jgi:hypothetical protein
MIYVTNNITNTNPIVFHFTGGSDDKRLRINDSVLCNNIFNKEINFPNETMDKNLKFVTAANKNNFRIIEQMKRNNVPLVVRGLEYGKNWRNVYKINLLIDEMKKTKEKYILFCDAIDVVFTDHPNNVLRRFLDNKGDELAWFNAEYTTWPKWSKFKEIDDFHKKTYKSKWNSLNSGAFIGEKDFLIHLCEESLNMFCDEHKWRDQPKIQQAHIKLYPKVKIDMLCKIFQVCWNKDNVLQEKADQRIFTVKKHMKLFV